MVRNSLNFIARLTTAALMMAISYLVIVPFFLHAANIYMVLLGWFLIPAIPVLVWFFWKVAFRSKKVVI